MKHWQFLVVNAALKTIRVVLEAIPMKEEVREAILSAKGILADLIEALYELQKSS